MILVLLGTQDKGFGRLLAEIEKQIENGTIQEKVIVQAGHTAFKSNRMDIFSLIPKSQMAPLISNARIVITHAGVGSILDCLKLGKKTIAVARLKKYKEHTNDHQLEILKAFGNQGHMVALSDVSGLHEALIHIDQFMMTPFTSNQANFLAGLKQKIDSLIER